MTIVLVRVDDRLIHGQVLEAWLPWTRADELIVPNDELAEDCVQQAILQTAAPQGVKLSIGPVAAIEDLLGPQDRSVRQMVILEHPRDALRLMRAGMPLAGLNLGNLVCEEGNVRLSRSVHIGESCLADLMEIATSGVQVNIQSVPFEKAIGLIEAFRGLDPRLYRRFCGNHTEAVV
jgi:sorbose PTS system EIIB component